MTARRPPIDRTSTPHDSPADNLILIAYEQWHQREVDTWVPLADELEATLESFRYYELPVVGKMCRGQEHAAERITAKTALTALTPPHPLIPLNPPLPTLGEGGPLR